jgi:hypothetical protein
MYLWDYEMRGYEQRLEQLPETMRFRIAVDVLERTINSLNPPIEDRASRQFFDDCFPRCREAIAAGLPLTPVFDGYAPALDALLASPAELGLQGLLLGMSFCFDEEFETQAAKNTYAVLSYCYEADLLRSCPDPFVTIEYERASTRCRDMIAFQKALVDGAAA